MGMGVGGYSGGMAQASAASFQQRQQNFSALSQALQSGSLSGAQAAFQTLTSNLPSSATSNPNSALAQIGTALQAGDLSGAQTAFTAMRSGHHHHGQGLQVANTNANTLPTLAAGGSNSGGTGSLLNVSI